MNELKILSGNYVSIRVLTEDNKEVAVITDDDVIPATGYKIALKPSLSNTNV